MNLNIYKSFNYLKKNKNNFILDFLSKLNKKQTVSLFLLFICLFFNVSYATVNNTPPPPDTPFQTMADILTSKDSNSSILMISFMAWASLIEITKYAINYIVIAQIDSIDIIASTPLGGAGIFDKLITALTIFAAIACFYKLIIHFRDTERFDNVKAYTGFFSYVGILVLFMFSSYIVNYVISFNSKINTNNIVMVGTTIDNELNQMIKVDFNRLVSEQNAIQKQIDNKSTGLLEEIQLETKKIMKELSFNFSNLLKYIYYSFFGLLMTSVLAVPSVIMTLMVKIILSIMILGSKLVFLLAFIPGFENTWKTYMLNLLNVMLWIPIFNVIITFIITLMSAMMHSHPSGTGQIIWLSIISLILAVQSISLTTTAASTIISGAGVGIGGALGGLNSMSGAAVIGGGAAAIAGSAVVVASMSKFSKE